MPQVKQLDIVQACSVADVVEQCLEQGWGVYGEVGDYGGLLWDGGGSVLEIPW